MTSSCRCRLLSLSLSLSFSRRRRRRRPGRTAGTSPGCSRWRFRWLYPAGEEENDLAHKLIKMLKLQSAPEVLQLGKSRDEHTVSGVLHRQQVTDMMCFFR